MFTDFHELNPQQIAALVLEYLEDTLFSSNKELEQVLAVAISGSVASGHYDQFSDIDLDFYCMEDSGVDRYQEVLLDFKKKTLAQSNTPLQIHRLKSMSKMANELSSYQDDNALREISQSVTVLDPQGHFSALQKNFIWYPEDVATEKLQWLYAQLVFEYNERYRIALVRDDLYYIRVSMLEILRLAGNALLVANKKWPAFDKHLYASLKSAGCDTNIMSKFDNALAANNNGLAASAGELVKSVEEYLVGQDLIPQETTKYWIDLRPAFSVNLG